MDFITLDEFIAEIETKFKKFTDTDDIDRTTVKTLVIDCLRKFGKNICEKRDKVVEIKNSRALLPETFKSLIVALRVDDVSKEECGGVEKRLIVEKQKIENPVQWDAIQRDYVANYCESKIVTEKTYVYNEREDRYYNYGWLSLQDGIKSDSLDSKCLNLHPSIRGNYEDKISITSRTLNTNFKEGKVYLQWNSLPADEEGEVIIPIFSTGDIKNYIENHVKVNLAETLILNDRQAQSISQFLSIWIQQQRQLFIFAKSEASYNGIDFKRFADRTQRKNRQNQALYNLPR